MVSGVKICKRLNPQIIHLLFTNDSAILCKADIMDRNVKLLLDRYVKACGVSPLITVSNRGTTQQYIVLCH